MRLLATTGALVLLSVPAFAAEPMTSPTDMRLANEWSQCEEHVVGYTAEGKFLKFAPGFEECASIHNLFDERQQTLKAQRPKSK